MLLPIPDRVRPTKPDADDQISPISLVVVRHRRRGTNSGERMRKRYPLDGGGGGGRDAWAAPAECRERGDDSQASDPSRATAIHGRMGKSSAVSGDRRGDTQARGDARDTRGWSHRYSWLEPSNTKICPKFARDEIDGHSTALSRCLHSVARKIIVVPPSAIVSKSSARKAGTGGSLGYGSPPCRWSSAAMPRPQPCHRSALVIGSCRGVVN
ncbi:hypothetical protein B0H12DRAFT_478455 [Mycena haematopus]|nr:hypothetical protein B0H12DRAFT_478455 [Mycena haematopus]